MSITLPTPRVRVVNESTRLYTFAPGVTGMISRKGAAFEWDLRRDGDSMPPQGSTSRGDFAFLRLWCLAAQNMRPDSLELPDIDELADQADQGEVTAVAKLYRRFLKQRTGFAWSVRVGKGDSRDTITISSTPSRKVAGKMTIHDSALLAGITGRELVNPSQGVTVSKRERRAMTYQLAGLPQPAVRVVRLGCETIEPTDEREIVPVSFAQSAALTMLGQVRS